MTLGIFLAIDLPMEFFVIYWHLLNMFLTVTRKWRTRVCVEATSRGSCVSVTWGSDRCVPRMDGLTRTPAEPDASKLQRVFIGWSKGEGVRDKGPVFTGVCDSVHKGGGWSGPGGLQVFGASDMVNERPVCILLECILVMHFSTTILSNNRFLTPKSRVDWEILDPPLLFFSNHF